MNVTKKDKAGSSKGKEKGYYYLPICSSCPGAPTRSFQRWSNAIYIEPCEKCGSGGVTIFVRAWKNMRKLEHKRKQATK